MIEIALFGTSADPPTIGHEMILRWLAQRYDFVNVWASDNPFKKGQIALEHRANMLDLLIKEIRIPKSNIILSQHFSSHRTLDTIHKAREVFIPDVELTLVVGSDLLPQLPSWYRAETLLRQVKLLVMPRPGYAIDESNLEVIRQLRGKITISNLEGLDVSSTSFRETGDMEILPKCVAAYINQQHLYTNARKQSKKDNTSSKSTFSG